MTQSKKSYYDDPDFKGDHLTKLERDRTRLEFLIWWLAHNDPENLNNILRDWNDDIDARAAIDEAMTSVRRLYQGQILVSIGGIGQTRASFWIVDRCTDKTAWISELETRNLIKSKKNNPYYAKLVPIEPIRRVGKQEKRAIKLTYGTFEPYVATSYSSFMGPARPWDGEAVEENGCY